MQYPGGRIGFRVKCNAGSQRYYAWKIIFHLTSGRTHLERVFGLIFRKSKIQIIFEFLRSVFLQSFVTSLVIFLEKGNQKVIIKYFVRFVYKYEVNIYE